MHSNRCCHKLALWSAAVGLGLALAVQAGTITVTHTADSGVGSFREALQQANTNPDLVRVEFAVQGTIRLQSALPTITGNVVISGSGSTSLRLSGEQAVPLLSVGDRGLVVVEKMILADGLGVLGGGAVYNLGNVTLRECLVSNNIGSNLGGAVLNYGTLVVDGCTFVSNRVVGMPGQSLISTNTAETGFNALGGAICSLQGSARMTNCTLWGNVAIGGRGGDNGLGAGGAGGAGLGGGVFFGAVAPSTNWMVNCTLSANQVFGGTGGLNSSIFGPPGASGWGTGGGILLVSNNVSLFLLNTILVGNLADHALPDGYGAVAVQSLGGNLVGVTNGLSGFTATDLVNVNPGLGALRSNGGPLPTCALEMDSVAIDAGQPAGAPAFDARGVIRPQGNSIDSGAYELGNQKILFPEPDSPTYGDAPHQLFAMATSELPVTFNVVSGPAYLSPTNHSFLVFTGAGPVTVMASQPGNDIYLAAPNVTNVVVVKKAVLAVAAADGIRPYGTANPAVAGTLTGVVNGDRITATFESAATTNTAAGVYGPGSALAIHPVLADPAGRLVHYTVLSTDGTLTIIKAALPLVAIGPNVNRPYGAANPTFQGTLTGLLNNDPISVNWSSAVTPASPVGDYSITAEWSDPERRLTNYTVVTNPGTLTVVPVPLTVTAADGTKAYGESNPTFSGTIAGLVNGDPVTALFRSSATKTTPAGRYGPASPYAIKPLLVDPAGRLVNYTLTSIEGTLTITKAARALTILGLTTNRPYGGTNLLWPVALEGILNGNPISAIWSSSTTPSTPVGSYALAPVWNDPSGILGNYDVITNQGTLAITPVSLTVTASDATRYYGAANLVFQGGAPVGLCNADPITVTYTSAATSTTPPGRYGPGHPFAIKALFNDPNGRLGNYTVTVNEGALTILSLPTVWIREPTNGSVFFPGMDVPVLVEVRGGYAPGDAIVCRFGTNLLQGVTTNGTHFSGTITNIGLGNYTMVAFMTNQADQTISSDPVDFSVVPIPRRVEAVDTTSLDVRQTGLYFQDVWVTNIASLPVPALLLGVSGLQPGVKVYNACQVTNQMSYLQCNYALAPGEVCRLRAEYYVPDGHTPRPSFDVRLTKPAWTATPSGTLISIPFIGSPWGQSAALLQFKTRLGCKYYVQYSTNLCQWTTIQPALMGNDNWFNWLDNGPPKTPSEKPLANCYYRVLQCP